MTVVNDNIITPNMMDLSIHAMLYKHCSIAENGTHLFILYHSVKHVGIVEVCLERCYTVVARAS